VLEEAEHGSARVPLKLHAARLALELPRRGRAWDARAPLPPHFAAALEVFGLPPPSEE
jgi:hypothetical protein